MPVFIVAGSLWACAPALPPVTPSRVVIRQGYDERMDWVGHGVTRRVQRDALRLRWMGQANQSAWLFRRTAVSSPWEQVYPSPLEPAQTYPLEPDQEESFLIVTAPPDYPLDRVTRELNAPVPPTLRRYTLQIVDPPLGP